MFFRYRSSVFVPNVLPNAASSAALATLIRRRLAATAALTLAKSCPASGTGLRPLPGLVRSPSMPSDSYRLSQVLTTAQEVGDLDRCAPLTLEQYHLAAGAEGMT